jgi:copper chaperone
MSLVHLRIRSCVMTCLMLLFAIGCKKSETAAPPKPVESTQPAGAAAAPAGVVDEPLVALAGTTLYQLDVQGMHCQGCADTITKKVQTVPGVKQARVSFNRKTAWVLVEASSPTRVPQIEKAVADAGYKAALAPGSATQPG